MIANSNQFYNLLYNGPYKVTSTSQMGFNVTIRNIIVSEKAADEKDNEMQDADLIELPDNN